MLGECIFCKIIKGEIPSAKVYVDDKMCVFGDVEPKAAVHLLAVPKTHFKLLEEMGEEERETLAYMLAKIPEIAKNNSGRRRGSDGVPPAYTHSRRRKTERFLI